MRFRMQRIELGWKPVGAPGGRWARLFLVGGGLLALWTAALTWPAWLPRARQAAGLTAVEWVGADPERAKEILRSTLPLSVEIGPEPPPAADWRRTWRGLVYRVTDHDFANARSFFEAEVPNPGWSTVPGGPAVERGIPPVRPPGESPEEGDTSPPGGGRFGAAPLVAIVHTHTSEMYRSDDFYPASADDYHRFNTADTGIVRVGSRLTELLYERYGIVSVHSLRVHDFPSYARAYIESGETVADLLRRYPSLEIILDLHREGADGLSLLTSVGGETVAAVEIVVGTAQAIALPHPRWPENLAFAQRFLAEANDRHPGLLRRILTVETGRYNQHLHPHMLLLEVGSYYDDESYAVKSAGLLADVIAGLLGPSEPSPRRPSAG